MIISALIYLSLPASLTNCPILFQCVCVHGGNLDDEFIAGVVNIYVGDLSVDVAERKAHFLLVSHRQRRTRRGGGQLQRLFYVGCLSAKVEGGVLSGSYCFTSGVCLPG